MKKTILAIDDSKAIRFLLQTVLGKDYQVVTAPDGSTAMHWLSKSKLPDLIICDPQLPDMRDWEILDELNNSILYSKIPVMIISSLDKDTLGQKREMYGVAEHFTKPFNPLAILESIHNLMSRKKVRGTYATSLN